MEQILAATQKLYGNYNISKDHDFTHVLAVYEHACKACDCDLPEDKTRFIILAAAVLHDTDDPKIFNTVDNHNARAILTDTNIDPVTATAVIELINLVSCRHNKNSEVSDKWKLIPRDCDRIEALGEIGIIRCYQYSLKINNPMFTSSTPRVTSIEELNKVATPERFARYNGKSASMIDHYYDKLLHIDVAASGNKYVQAIIDKRKQMMVDFVLFFGRTGTIDMTYLNKITY